MTERIKTRDELIAEAQRIHDEIKQMFVDAEYWNNLHPDHPIDPDPDGFLKHMLEVIGGMLEREKTRSMGIPMDQGKKR